MSFEGVVCPEDGAREGITQVEADTFYCSHHKGLFKYVDPSRIKVQVEGSFCPCGNRVEFQCQLCERGLCPECDVIEWQMGAWTPSGHPFAQPTRHSRILAVPTPGFGYLERKESETRKKDESVWSRMYESQGEHVYFSTFGTLKSGFVVNDRIGASPSPELPVLHADEIIPQLAKGHTGGLRHVCCSCLVTGAPAAIDEITQGRMCEHPCCAVPPESRCRCCHAAFCTRHTCQTIGDDLRLMAAFIEGGGSLEVVHAPQVEGLCHMCAVERMLAARLKAIEICDSQRGISRKDEFNQHKPVYEVVAGPLRWRGRDESGRRDRAHREAKIVKIHVVEALAAWVREIEKKPMPCAKNLLFDVPLGILKNYELARTAVIYEIIHRKSCSPATLLALTSLLVASLCDAG